MLIVGLGNPGTKYIDTRHNLGFMVLEEFAQKKLSPAIIWEINDKFKVESLEMGPNLTLLRPQTFMNLSGESVSKYAAYFKIDPEEIVVIHDDLDLPLGKIKIRSGGSAAGHHGVESIINNFKNDHFIRIRLGIGNLHTMGGERGDKHFDAERFVVSPFLANEKSKVKHMIKSAVEALQTLLDEGIEVAQNQYN